MPDPTPTTTADQLVEIHLVVRLSNEFGTADEIVGALTTDCEADRLMQVHEDLVGGEEAYEIRTVRVHSSAAAVLGVA